MFLFTYPHNSVSKWSAVKSRFQCVQKATISLLQFPSLRVGVSVSFCRSVERGAQLCLPRRQRADLHLSRKKACAAGSSLWECVGVGRARQSELANERVRGTGKQACSSQQTDAHPVQRERREGDTGLSVPCLVIRSCLSLTTTQGYFSKRTGTAQDGQTPLPLCMEVWARGNSFCECIIC